jgi:hypothetical protein
MAQSDGFFVDRRRFGSSGDRCAESNSGWRLQIQLPNCITIVAGGYGTARIPMEPGIHRIEIVTWRPLGSAFQEFAGT